jgi:hypothetical protein
MSDGENSACPCGAPTYPAVVFNPAGRNSVAYRFGDYAAVRQALLRGLPGEAALTAWQPAPGGDLAVQLVEWWAYLADILSLYNERIANESWLRTATLSQSVNRLIQLLGYRPRPAIAATGVLAALLSRTKPVTLPKGFQIQSKPGPSKQPQVFELAADAVAVPLDTAALVIAPTPVSLVSGSTASLLVAASAGGLKPGDEVLLIAKGWAGADGNWAVGTVAQLAPQTAPTGATNTAISVTLASQGGDLSAAMASGFRLMKIGGTATLYQYEDPAHGWSAIGQGEQDASGNNTGFAELASIFRQIAPGDVIVLEDPRSSPANPAQAASVTSIQELVYYANNPTNPPQPPDPGSPPHIPAIPIPHTRLNFTLPGSTFGDATTVVVRFGFTDVGTLIDPPAISVPASPSAPTILDKAEGEFTQPAGTPLLVEDANGDGVAASVDTPTTLRIAPPAPELAAPLDVLFNLLQVSRGKTVAGEVLGSGNANIAEQDFTLRNAPVTYLQDPASLSGDDYSSTVEVSVNGVQWSEVRSFYGQPPDAQVFVTTEDEQGNTHVAFGDGTNGARLPTGTGNVVATYRYGAGADVPDAGSLTMVLQPQPGLRAIRNPVPPAGGADPDPPGRVRTLAPRSVLTFGRAISLDDYAAIAATAPGVKRVSAAYTFDALAQRPMVSLWVGDDDGAVTAAKAAIAAAADPNRPVAVNLAQSIVVTLSLTYLRDQRYDDAAVRAALHAALLDPDQGLFGANVVQIGQAFYESQISAACLAVPGVEAVRNIDFSAGLRFVPVGRTLAVRAFLPVVSVVRPFFVQCAGHRFDPGSDKFFIIPDDPQHLVLTPGTA